MSAGTEDVDFSTIPLLDRLVHKSWKARQHGYEELEKVFKTLEPDNESEYKKYHESLKKIPIDSNLVAQESGMAAILSFLQYAPNPQKMRASIVPLVVDKCLASTRAGTRAKALEILLLFIEVDVAEPVIEDILTGLDHKTPKNVAACVNCLKEAVKAFGPKVVSPKLILKQLSKIFDHKDKNVRTEGTLLAIELYKYLGLATMTQFLSDLKPVQVKELNEEFEKIPAQKYSPERFLRSQQKTADAEAEAEQPEPEAEEPEVVDVYDFADAVNLVDKIPKGFYEQLTSTKWKERKEALESILPLAKSPKLDENARYGELLSALGKRMNDANILVVVLAANCVEGIALGLRSNFQQYKSLMTSSILERCKEKKQNVIDALRAALDAIFASFGFFTESLIEDILTACAHKNPQVRVESFGWFARSLKQCGKAPGKNELKSIVETSMKGIDDGDNGVRTAAAECLGVLLKVLGERSILAGYFEKLDTNKMSKVKEFCDNAVVKGKKKSKASVEKENVPPPVKSAPAKPPTRPSTSDRPKSTASAPKKVSSSAAPKKKPSSSVPSSTSDAPLKSSPKETFDVSCKYTDESAEEVVQALLDQNKPPASEGEEGASFAGLSSSNWKIRLASVQLLLETLKARPAGELDAEAVIRVLLKKPGLKENNFQVMTNMIQIMQHVTKDPSFTPGCVSLVAPGLADKLGDAKVKRAAGDCLTAMAEVTSFGFVLSFLYEPIKKQKAPKVISDSLTWIQQTLLEFGIKGIKLSDLLDCVKVCLGNTNAGVRNAGVILLGCLRMYIGPDIRGLLTDVNPALLTVIDAEFEKNATKTPPVPTKVKSVPTPQTSTVSHAILPHDEKQEPTVSDTSMNEDMMDDLLPRVDISTLITEKLIEEIGDAQWKIRKEGLDNLSSILEQANQRIKPTLGNDIIPALRARLGDTNRNLAIAALDLCGTLATSMGRPFEKHVKGISGAVASCLADNKVHVRTAAINALDAFKSQCSLDSFLVTLSQPLMGDQPLLRKDLLKWLGETLEGSKKGIPDMSSFVHSILLCVQDRNSEVRKYAQIVLLFVIQNVGYDTVKDKAAELFKGAQLQTVLPIIESASGTSATTKPTSSLAKGPSTPGRKRVGSAASTATRDDVSNKVASKAPSRSKLATRTGSLTLKKEPVEVAVDKEPPLLTSDARLKEMRADKDRGLTKWVFEVPRRELIDFLSEQCEGNFSAEVHGLMFSTDHYKERDYIHALTALLDPILCPESCQSLYGLDFDSMRKRYVANADLVLKYLTLRFFDTNTSMLIKCLELLENFLSLLEEAGHYLSEYEASCFLPVFVNKVGDNKETMRVKIRAIMKQLCRIYPASKLFNYIMKGVESKNARTRTECLDELGLLVQRNGLSVCIPSKCFPLIASQIGDRDAGVRNAALGAITQAYLLVGDQVYKYLGRLSDKDKSLLEEKLKRLPAAAGVLEGDKQKEVPVTMNASPEKGVEIDVADPQITEKRPSSPSKSSAGIKREFSLDLDKLDLGKFSQSAQLKSTSSIPTVSSSSSLGGQETMMDFIITQITETDMDLSINALKQLEKVFSSNPEKLDAHINEIITAITMQVRIAFTTADLSTHSTSRLCKHLVNMLVQIFSSTELPKKLKKESLRQCIQELLNRLLDPSLPNIENGTQLTRALNVLMVRILDNSNRNTVFSVLLEILDHSTRLVRDISQDILTAQAKYTELVMKCIWKMTKLIPQLIESKAIDISLLLLDVHNFLIASPPSEWKRRTTQKIIPQADMPLRTVKTILHEIVSVMEDRVFEHLQHIADVKTSHAVAYLRQMVENEHKKKYGTSYQPPAAFSATSCATGMMATALEPTTSAKNSPISKRPLSMPPALQSEMSLNHEADVPKLAESVATRQLSSEEINQRLDTIFEKIRDKELTKQAIYELYLFQKNNPYVAGFVDVHLNRTNTYFQGYIRRGLQTHAEEESMRRSPAQRPVSMITPRTVDSEDSLKKPLVSETYREKLEKLQRMFNKEEQLISPVVPEPSLSVAAAAETTSRTIPPTSESVADRGNNSQTVADLKERLARMKLNMNKA